MKCLRPLIIVAGLLLVWQIIVWVTGAPHFILPGPALVWATLIDNFALLIEHAQVTLIEILLGIVFGSLLGISTAVALIWFRPLRSWMLPVLVISQAIPVFALAPVLVLWLGYGMASKVVMAILIIYFPVTAACFDGLRHAPQDLLDLAKTMGATPKAILWQVRFPAALPSLGSGLRVAASVAPIGAVVGEWVGSSTGLGYLMLQANARMQVDLMFAALVILAIIAVALYFTVDKLARAMTPWQKESGFH